MRSISFHVLGVATAAALFAGCAGSPGGGAGGTGGTGGIDDEPEQPSGGRGGSDATGGIGGGGRGGSGGGGTGGMSAGGIGGTMPLDAGVDAPHTDAAGGSGTHDGGHTSADVAPAVRFAPAGASCPSGETFGNPLPAGAMARRTAVPGASFLEGPVWIAAQNAFYFSDFSGTGSSGRIWKYTPADGKLTEFLKMVGTNGLAVDDKGMILAASHDMQWITRIDPLTAGRTRLPGSGMFMNAPFNSVNDLVARADGNIYFTDPTYQRGNRPGQSVMGVYRVAPDGMISRFDSRNGPNGINISPDGKWLYAATTGGQPVKRYPLNADGTVGEGATFINGRSDGMAVDCAGNLYLTDGSVRVYSAAGMSLGQIGGISGSSNVAFGGEDGKTLLVTAGTAIYTVKLNVPGLPN